jgi:hypothetical protein
MAKRQANGGDRARQVLAQEAARIIVEQGIEDYRIAKLKAAERLGMSARGSLPGNTEIEKAVSEHLALFGRESHLDFTPRLVGPVLHGTASANSAVNLHVFADDAETVAVRLQEYSVQYRPFDRRLKSRRDRAETFAAFRFTQDESFIEATVFPVDGVRQAPISPVDGKPMRRADRNAILKLLRD